jgi:hypothetical protein
MEKLTKQQIVDQVIEKYVGHPENRAKHDGDCVYLDPETGNRCALGQYSISEDLDFFLGSISIFNEKYSVNIDNCLKPNVRGHSVRFWTAVQVIHDTEFLCSGTKEAARLWASQQPELEYILQESR